MRKKLSLARNILFILLFIWAIYRYFPQIQELLNSQKDSAYLKAHFQQPTALNLLILLALTALSTAIPGMSSAIFCIFNGILFGIWIAIPLNIAGNVLGNSISYLILSRIEKPERSERRDRLISWISKIKNPFLGICLAYALPFIPTVLTNFTTTELGFSHKKRTIAMLVGALPFSILYASGGNLLLLVEEHKLLIGLAFLLLLLIFIGLYFFYYKRKSLKEIS